jgi:hypothetical protein
MSRNSLIYFMLCILLQALVEVNCQFKPNVSDQHTATFIDNKLYILSGFDLIRTQLLKEFFYLDVSSPFDTQNLSWQDLSNINMIPPHASATSVKGGANNDTLFLYGGFTNDSTMSPVYTFDSHSNVWTPWNIPQTAEINTVRKYELTGIINYNGKLYLWSGNTGTAFANEMFILDTINLGWSKGSVVNAPTPRVQYGATLLPDNKIIYIGKRVAFFNDILFIFYY